MQGDGFTGRKLHIALKNLAKRIRLSEKNNSKEWLLFKMIITILNCQSIPLIICIVVKDQAVELGTCVSA
jgi:hypothetical protein